MFSVFYSLTILISFIISSGIYLILYKFLDYPSQIISLKNNEKKEKFVVYISNFVSLIHSTIMVILSLMVQERFDPNTILKPNSKFDNIIIEISFGYFLYDSFISTFVKKIDLQMVVHHILALLIYLYVLNSNLFANKIIELLWIGEISAPFLFLYENLEQHKKYENASKVFGFLFCFIFLFARCFLMVIEHYVLMNYADFPLVIKLFSIGVTTVSWIWAFMIFNKLVKALNEITGKKLNFLYNMLQKLRKIKNFNIFLNLFIFYLSAGPLLKMKFNKIY
jgi:hypothetical protein